MGEKGPLPEVLEARIDFTGLDTLMEEWFNRDEENLIMILQAIQGQYNHLPGAALIYVSRKMNVPLSRIYGIATFYSSFSLQPRGRNIVSICLGTACHVRGADRIHERMGRLLQVGDGQTTNDGEFTLETVRCIGCCSLGPVVRINEDIHARLTVDRLEDILGHYGKTRHVRPRP